MAKSGAQFRPANLAVVKDRELRAVLLDIDQKVRGLYEIVAGLVRIDPQTGAVQSKQKEVDAAPNGKSVYGKQGDVVYFQGEAYIKQSNGVGTDWKKITTTP